MFFLRWGRGWFLFFLILPLLQLSALASENDPLSGSLGARPLALGGAYAGLADDGSALFINPAGLGGLKQPKFISLYTQFQGGVSLTLLGGVVPAFWDGSFGLGYRSRTTANLQVTSQETTDYTDQDLTISFSKQIRTGLSLGLNYRLITKGLSRDIAGYEGLNGSGNTLDLGLRYSHDWLGLGLAFQNTAGKLNYRDGRETDLAGKLTLGSSLKIGGEAAIFNFDISRMANEPVSTYHAGLEWRPVDLFALRLGVDQSPQPNSAENYNHLTAGFGVKYSGVIFDYSFRRQGDPSQIITHNFSLAYEVPVGKAPSIEAATFEPFDAAGQPDRPVSRAELVVALVRAKGSQLPGKNEQVFRDVPASYWAAPYIQSAFENKLIAIARGGNFEPRKHATRAEAVTLISKLGGKSRKIEAGSDHSLTRAELAELINELSR